MCEEVESPSRGVRGAGALAGLRARRGRLDHPGGRGRLRPHHPRPAGAGRLRRRPVLRRRVLPHPHLLDARGRDTGLDHALDAGDPLLRPDRCAVRGRPAAPALAPVVRLGVDGHRGVAQRLAAGRHALGPARLRQSWTLPSPRRCPTPAQWASASCSPCRARCWRGWSAARSRGRGAAGWRRSPWSDWWPCSPYRRWRRGRPRPIARSPWQRCRATCRATGTTSSTTIARSPRTMWTPPSTWPGGWRRARRRSPTWSSGRRTPRRSTPSTTPRPTPGSGPRARRSACRSWWGRSSTASSEGQVLNQGIVWDPQTGAGDRYTKWHPVPFGEYIPFRSVFTSTTSSTGSARSAADMISGTRGEPLDIGGVQVADAICFDIAYDDGLTAQLRNGAELLVVQTSNATFIHTDQIDQQFAITRLRAHGDRPLGRGRHHQRRLGGHRTRRPRRRHSDKRTQAVLVEPVGLTEPADPGDPDRTLDRAGRDRPDGARCPARPAPVSSEPTAGDRARHADRVTHARRPQTPRKRNTARCAGASRLTTQHVTRRHWVGSSWSSRPTTRPTTSPGWSAGSGPRSRGRPARRRRQLAGRHR